MDIGRWFTAHPETVGETYAEHLGMATSFGCRMVLAGVACMLHGVLPLSSSAPGVVQWPSFTDR